MALVRASLFFKGIGIYGAGKIVFDLVLAENHNYDSVVTNHPVEDGSEISDHIQNELQSGDITGLVSNYSINASIISSITSFQVPALVSNRAEDVLNALIALWESKSLFTMTTILKTYNNVAITSMPVTLDESSSDSLVFQISFQEVKVVKLQEISLEVKVDNLDSKLNRQVSPAHDAGRTVGGASAVPII